MVTLSAGSAPGGNGDDVLSTRGRQRRSPPQRHQWFDAWKTAKGDGLKILVEATLAFVAHHEGHTKSRVRARRAVDDEHHRRRVEAVVCNLAHAVLIPPPTERIAMQLGNKRKGRSRYDSPVMGRTLSPLLLLLDDLDILHMKWSTSRGEVSSMAPTAWFSRKVAEHGVQLADFGRHETEEVIFLTRNTRPAASRFGDGERTLHREPIDYRDTAATRRHRDALRSFNAFLANAQITFDGGPDETRVDPFDRTLRRRFVILAEQAERFDQGGRLFGGFWQGLPKANRRDIRIDGEQVVELDYGTMFTRLAYAEVGAMPPEGDLYAIPELAGYRSGVKMAMNTLLFDGGPRRSWPKELGVGVGTDADAAADPVSAARYDARLPQGWTVKRTKEAILRVHPHLKNAWGRRLGYALMFRESEILMAVLQHLAATGIPALGLHDGLIVPASRATTAREVMERKAMELAGVSIPVGMTGGSYPSEGD